MIKKNLLLFLKNDYDKLLSKQLLPSLLNSLQYLVYLSSSQFYTLVTREKRDNDWTFDKVTEIYQLKFKNFY